MDANVIVFVSVLVVITVVVLIVSSCLRKRLQRILTNYEKMITSLTSELEKHKDHSNSKDNVIDAKDKLIVELQNKTQEAESKAGILEYNYKELDDKFRTTLNQKVSSEVKMGRIGEQFFCFMNEFPYDPNDFRFIGSPVDGLQFNYDNDEIIFIEIKTGKSRLSDRQKKCREIIKKGNIKFMEFRVGEEGVDIKMCGKDESILENSQD